MPTIQPYSPSMDWQPLTPKSQNDFHKLDLLPISLDPSKQCSEVYDFSQDFDMSRVGRYKITIIAHIYVSDFNTKKRSCGSFQ